MKELKRRLPFSNTCISSGDIQVWKMCKVCKWMTDDVIHSTQYYIICINWAILANMQRRTLKLGRLIVLQETQLRLQKFWCHGNSLFSSPHPLDFNVLAIFSSKNVIQGHKLTKNIFICLLDHVYQALSTNRKIERQGWPKMSLILGRSGTQYVAMEIKLLGSK